MMDPKTPDQLTREIAYFVDVLHRSTSRDRIERAHRALRRLERQLTDEQRRERVPHHPLTAA